VLKFLKVLPQSLVEDPIISRSDELGNFLSKDSPFQVNAPARTPSRSNIFAGQTLVRNVYKSVTESIDDIFYGPSMLDVVIQSLTTQAAQVAGIVGAGVNDEELVAQAFKAKADARSIPPEAQLLELSNRIPTLDEESVTSSFSAPICDLILAVFELDPKNNWLRRQAVVIILQQVLGSTIER
jgi:sorting nexin-25